MSSEGQFCAKCGWVNILTDRDEGRRECHRCGAQLGDSLTVDPHDRGLCVVRYSDAVESGTTV